MAIYAFYYKFTYGKYPVDLRAYEKLIMARMLLLFIAVDKKGQKDNHENSRTNLLRP